MLKAKDSFWLTQRSKTNLTEEDKIKENRKEQIRNDIWEWEREHGKEVIYIIEGKKYYFKKEYKKKDE